MDDNVTLDNYRQTPARTGKHWDLTIISVKGGGLTNDERRCVRRRVHPITFISKLINLIIQENYLINFRKVG